MTSDSVAFIVGGARGCGRAAAVRLAEDGADVAVSDVAEGGYQTLDYGLATEADLEETTATVRATGQRALGMRLDVRDRGAVAASVERVEREMGPITQLVVAAGVVSGVAIHEMSRLQWDEVVGTNLTGAFNVVQAVVPRMAARSKGSVVLICGAESRRGAAELSHVSAAGWALIGMAKSVALEVAASGVTVNVVSCGPVRSEPLETSTSFARALTRMTDNESALEETLAAANPQGRPCVDPDEVGDIVAFLASGRLRSMTGAVLDLDLGLAGRNSA